MQLEEIAKLRESHTNREKVRNNDFALHTFIENSEIRPSQNPIETFPSQPVLQLLPSLPLAALMIQLKKKAVLVKPFGSEQPPKPKLVTPTETQRFLLLLNPPKNVPESPLQTRPPGGTGLSSSTSTRELEGGLPQRFTLKFAMFISAYASM